MNDVEIASIQSNFIFNEVFRIRMTKEIDLIWFEFIHFCDIDLDSTHEKNYAMCIKWIKLSEKENRLSTTWWFHVVETIKLTLYYQ